MRDLQAQLEATAVATQELLSRGRTLSPPERRRSLGVSQIALVMC